MTIETTPTKSNEVDTKLIPPYNVVLLDDNDHTWFYVINMLAILFGYPRSTGYKMTAELDSTGRVIVWTGPFETAELKRDQIHAFGRDRRVACCKGSMSAILEPAIE